MNDLEHYTKTGTRKNEYEEFILKLTNEARQRSLTEIEKGILRSEGQIGKLQAENKALKANEAYELDLPPTKRTICLNCTLPAEIKQLKEKEKL